MFGSLKFRKLHQIHLGEAFSSCPKLHPGSVVSWDPNFSGSSWFFFWSLTTNWLIFCPWPLPQNNGACLMKVQIVTWPEVVLFPRRTEVMSSGVVDMDIPPHTSLICFESFGPSSAIFSHTALCYDSFLVTKPPFGELCYLPWPCCDLKWRALGYCPSVRYREFSGSVPLFWLQKRVNLMPLRLLWCEFTRCGEVWSERNTISCWFNWHPLRVEKPFQWTNIAVKIRLVPTGNTSDECDFQLLCVR